MSVEQPHFLTFSFILERNTAVIILPYKNHDKSNRTANLKKSTKFSRFLRAEYTTSAATNALLLLANKSVVAISTNDSMNISHHSICDCELYLYQWLRKVFKSTVLFDSL